MPVSIVTSAQITADFQVIDARSPNAFRRERLMGSIPLHWRDFTMERPGLWNLLFGHPPRWGRLALGPEVEIRLKQLGLSHSRPVLVVGSPEEAGAEGRTAWNLLCWGAESVSILDGGFPALSGKSMERGRPLRATPGDFHLRLQAARIAEEAAVRRALEKKDRVLFDVRTEKEFNGQRAPGQKRGGHLPGATLVPMSALYRPDGTFITVDELKRLAPHSECPITYCTGGVRSALLAVLLEARLGIKAANYDGSLWEWSAKPDLPMVQ